VNRTGIIDANIFNRLSLRRRALVECRCGFLRFDRIWDWNAPGTARSKR
jgi:hypothetical protein